MLNARHLLLLLGALALALGSCAESPRAAAPAQVPWFIQGYPDRISYAPGERVEFHVSTNLAGYDAKIARLGATREFKWEHRNIAGGEHAVPPDASSHGCRWPASFTFAIPADWPSGYYEVYTGANDPHDPSKWVDGQIMYFVVRSAHPGRDAHILLQLTTDTYNAYNNFGGQSLYPFNSRDEKQSPRVSFHRPINSDAPRWETPFIQWAEKNGYRLDYAVNSDLEFHPDLLQHYRLVLSVGHDEYWSRPMRDNLEAFIGAGGNVAFFAGNVSCWQIRFEERGDAIACWKQFYKNDPLYREGSPNPLLTAHWSSPLVGRPENQMTGVGFQFGGFHRSNDVLMDGTGAFKVHRPEHWVFAGTGLKEGDSFGGGGKIVGYECDGCEFVLRDAKPVPTGRDGTPAGFAILASAPARWPAAGGPVDVPWDSHRMGAACLGLYTKPGGGTVFTAATTDWAHGLQGQDPAVEQITRNVLDRLSK